MVAVGDHRRRISATTLAQYVRFGNCDRLLYFSLHPEKAEELEAGWRVSPQPLTPLLRAAGEEFEREVLARVCAAGEVVEDLSGQRAGATLEQLDAAAAGRRVVLAQARLEGQIGEWPCGGNADLIWLVPGERLEGHAQENRRGAVTAIVADVKSSLKERVEHRLQVAFYVRLLRQMAAAHGIDLLDVRGCGAASGRGRRAGGHRGGCAHGLRPGAVRPHARSPADGR